MYKVRYENDGVSWVWNSSLRVIKVKVNKGAVKYLIYFQMEKCNWIRGKTYWGSHQYTSSSIGQNNKVTTYVLQGFSLLLGSKSFKKIVCMCWSRSVCVKKMDKNKMTILFSFKCKIYFCTRQSSIFKSTHVMWGNLVSVSIQLIFQAFVQSLCSLFPLDFLPFYCLTTLNHSGSIQRFSLLRWRQSCTSQCFLTLWRTARPPIATHFSHNSHSESWTLNLAGREV